MWTTVIQWEGTRKCSRLNYTKILVDRMHYSKWRGIDAIDAGEDTTFDVRIVSDL